MEITELNLMEIALSLAKSKSFLSYEDYMEEVNRIYKELLIRAKKDKTD